MEKLGNEWVNNSVSCATYRTVDVLANCAEVLEIAANQQSITSEKAELMNVLAEARAYCKILKAFEQIGILFPSLTRLRRDTEDEAKTFLNEVIWDYMDEIAPNGTTFEAHPGDMTDFGFWEYDKDGELYV